MILMTYRPDTQAVILSAKRVLLYFLSFTPSGLPELIETGVVVGDIMDMDSARKWIVEHKLRAVGTLWATSLLGSLTYNFAKPGMKLSVKLIHARSLHPVIDANESTLRLHAQFLTLAALAGSAAVEAYDQQAGDKAKRYEKQFQT